LKFLSREETLTLHRLAVFAELGVSFKTTNLIESVMARVEAKTHRVSRWRTSDQKQRWCAAALLQREQQSRCVKGVKQLSLRQAALRSKLSDTTAAASAAILRHSPEFQLNSGHSRSV